MFAFVKLESKLLQLLHILLCITEFTSQIFYICFQNAYLKLVMIILLDCTKMQMEKITYESTSKLRL